VNILVDATVWSAALRRKSGEPDACVAELTSLIAEGRVVMLGAIRQEILSGVKVQEQFRELRNRLRAFEDLELDATDYENAAACYNECRGKGIQGSNADFLLCAVSLRRDLPIFSNDGDFEHYARAIGVTLHRGRAA
jgi:predicted nucleic acid-binding protein